MMVVMINTLIQYKWIGDYISLHVMFNILLINKEIPSLSCANKI